MEKEKVGIDFLYESGLLFEINRKVLHPLGFVLSLVDNEKEGFISIELERVESISENAIFNDQDLAVGTTKLLQFLFSSGFKSLQDRQKALGFLNQGMELFSLIDTVNINDFVTTHLKPIPATSNFSPVLEPLDIKNSLTDSLSKDISSVPVDELSSLSKLSVMERNAKLKEKYDSDSYFNQHKRNNNEDGMIPARNLTLDDLDIVQVTKKSCLHPSENIEIGQLNGGGSTIFCSLCGTTFKLKDRDV